jgi:hypothetical protein
MKATFALALFAIIMSSAVAFESCVAFHGFNAWNLCPYAKKDINFTVTTAITAEDITFSIADDHVLSCDGTKKVYATDKTFDGKCYNISQANPAFNLINSSNSTEGLTITYPAVNISENIAYNTSKQLVVVLKCNMAATSVNGTKFGTPVLSTNGTNTVYTVTGESRYACPGSADFLIEFIKENKTVFGTVLIVLGSLFNFFGFKLVKFTIFAIATVVGFAGSGMFLYSQVSITTSKPVFWVLALFCLVLGLGLGYAAHKLRQVAVFFVGAALGLVGGYVLYTAVLNAMLGSPANGNTYLYVTQIVCALIGGILAFVLNEIIFIVSTSVVGSYMVASAIALFSGQFHNEDVMNGDFEFGQYKYFYYAGMVILAGCGIYYQHVSKSKNQEEIENNNANANVPKYGYAYYRY